MRIISVTFNEQDNVLVSMNKQEVANVMGYSSVYTDAFEKFWKNRKANDKIEIGKRFQIMTEFFDHAEKVESVMKDLEKAKTILKSGLKIYRTIEGENIDVGTK